ncbi:MAG: type II secretion system F family protein [Planctomycetota bacterium]
MSQATVRNGARPDERSQGTKGFLESLHSIKFGSDPSQKFKRKDLILFLRNVTTLVHNGVSLLSALETISRDDSLKRYRSIVTALARDIKGGKSLSDSLKAFPQAFSENLINQIRIGERAGALDMALSRVTLQLEQSSGQMALLLKKLTYPAILMVAGVGSVSFMLVSVIPTFEELYADSGATLPGITQLLIDLSGLIRSNGILIAGAIGAVAFGCVALLKNPTSRMWIDRNLLHLPILGNLLRNIAILQFSDVVANLMESGFTLVEALPPATRAIGNRHVRHRIQSLYSAVRRGERFSQSLHREGDLFPPVVNQLVIVGEQTGRLADVTRQIREHLKKDVDNKLSAMVGALEPILTAALAFAVGGILLAVYLPMFDLIGQAQ